jgi:cephalosporin hydroxylase
MAHNRIRRDAIGTVTGFAMIAVVVACGPDPESRQAPSDEVAPVELPAAPTPASLITAEYVVGRMPQPSDPSRAPQLRKLMRSRPDVKNFVAAWHMNPAGLWSNQFLGVKTLQNPLDVWVTQEILFDVKPDYIVEAGTLHGGSALQWAILLEHINPKGRVITIDIEDMVTDAREFPIWKRKVDFLVGSSTDPAIVAEVTRRVGGGTVLVILDSLHTEEHVRAELEAYAPLVSLGSYVIVQDTGGYSQPPEQKFPGGGRAAKKFLEANDAFEFDRGRERYVLTNNAYGFLRRVR